MFIEAVKSKDENGTTKAAYKPLKCFVNQNVVDVKGAEKLTSVFDRYMSAKKETIKRIEQIMFR